VNQYEQSMNRVVSPVGRRMW